MAKPTQLEIVENVALFRAGNYGEKGDYTIADLQAIAEDYNSPSNQHEAPATVDHKQEGPKFGNAVKGTARVEGDLLFANMALHPQFVDVVRNKMYDKRSVELYKDRDSNGKDAPGKYSLRAVTFLGAQPPEVKGLPDIQLSEGKDAAVHIDFSESPEAPITPTVDTSAVAEIVQTLVAKEIQKLKESLTMDQPKDTEKPEELKALMAEVEGMKPEEIKAMMDNYKKKMQEGTTPAPTETEKALRAELESMKAKQAESDKKAAESAREAFSEKVEREAKDALDRGVAPALVAQVKALNFADYDNKEVVTFGEGDAAKDIKKSVAFSELLKALPSAVPNHDRRTTNSTKFSEDNKSKANDTTDSETHKRAKEIQTASFSEGNKISYRQALNQAQKELY